MKTGRVKSGLENFDIDLKVDTLKVTDRPIQIGYGSKTCSNSCSGCCSNSCKCSDSCRCNPD